MSQQEDTLTELKNTQAWSIDGQLDTLWTSSYSFLMQIFILYSITSLAATVNSVIPLLTLAV